MPQAKHHLWPCPGTQRTSNKGEGTITPQKGRALITCKFCCPVRLGHPLLGASAAGNSQKWMPCLPLLNPGNRFLVLLQLETSKSGCPCLPFLNRPFLPLVRLIRFWKLLQLETARSPVRPEHPLAGAFPAETSESGRPCLPFLNTPFFAPQLPAPMSSQTL